MNDYQRNILKKLRVNNNISYNELLDITNAFQITSAQGYAIGSTKGILDFLKNYGEILITDAPDEKNIRLKKISDLSELYLVIDEFIDIKHDHNFSTYWEV